MSDHLLSPTKLVTLSLANRVVMAPMTRCRAGDAGIPNGLMLEYYQQRATAGLIITEGAHVSDQAVGWWGAPGIYTGEMETRWGEIAAAVHGKGGHIFMQLWHTGRASHSLLRADRTLGVSSSAIPIGDQSKIRTPEGWKSYETPRALPTDEIAGLVSDYANAARRARSAGFDGVEIHAANGYLLDQFLQSRVNKRTDQYGGSVEARCRLLLQVTDAVVDAWGAADRVGVRLSPNGVYNDMGSPDARAQFLCAATELAKRDVGYLHIVDGGGFGFHGLGAPMRLDEFRAVFPHTIIGNGGYTQETAEGRIASGSANLIAFGRPFIANPDLVARFAQGLPLAPSDDKSVWYDFGPSGYADYPDFHDATGRTRQALERETTS